MVPIVSEVAHSEMAVNANAVQNKSDLLSSIQKIIRNELLAARSTDTAVKNAKQATVTPSLQQGREQMAKASHAPSCGSTECHGECQDYIKKDAIPCWGCSLDY